MHVICLCSCYKLDIMRLVLLYPDYSGLYVRGMFQFNIELAAVNLEESLVFARTLFEQTPGMFPVVYKVYLLSYQERLGN